MCPFCHPSYRVYALFQVFGRLEGVSFHALAFVAVLMNFPRRSGKLFLFSNDVSVGHNIKEHSDKQMTASNPNCKSP